MVQARWHGMVIADSDSTIMIEGNHYFPPGSVRRGLLVPTETTSTCPWKGSAHYYSIRVDADENVDAGWYYPDPKPAAAEIKDHVASGRGSRSAR